MQHLQQVVPCQTTHSVGLWPSSSPLEERCSIARLHEDGQSSRQIAATLDRQPSTIARELKRNTGRKIGYQPAYAQSLTAARRWTGNKLERDDALRETVLTRLTAGWSPEQIAGRLAREQGQNVISHETIYRFVYAQIKRTNDTKWRLYLPRAKIKRGWRTKACPERLPCRQPKGWMAPKRR